MASVGRADLSLVRRLGLEKLVDTQVGMGGGVKVPGVPQVFRAGMGAVTRTSLGSKILKGAGQVLQTVAGGAVATKVASKLGPLGKVAAGGAAFGAGAAGVESLLAGAEVVGSSRGRGRGITAAELRGFNKVCALLSKVGMKPKRCGGASPRRKRCR